MQTKLIKLTAVPSYNLFDVSKPSSRAVGWRYSWNNGETTDVFLDPVINHPNIIAKEI